ncbi:DnaD domain-containing protein [Bacillus chungangensis]|uniref:DnaD/phage-associated family protein n=1 Tax=Bacillus chungangensis TaxID=587633 RepID=A0ABT9WS71_9BACI|nr:DnaD domain protein [Bacillus chungangensis]MDQ0176026.1 DnaD/phage-associated family protein [Bacillus chungangensis]
MKAQHKPYKNLKRGQVIVSIPELIEECSYKVGYRTERPKKSQIYNVLDWLRSSNETSNEGNAREPMIKTTKTTRGLIVTISNYNVYQDSKNYEQNKEMHKESEPKETRTKRQPDTINKNVKNLREEEEEKMNAFSFYQQNFGMPSPYIAQSIGMWIDDTSEEIVIEAMKEGLRNNARTFKYCESILKDWYSKNIRRLSDLKVQQQYTRNPKVTPINKKQDNLAQLDAIFKKMGLKEEVQ